MSLFKAHMQRGRPQLSRRAVGQRQARLDCCADCREVAAQLAEETFSWTKSTFQRLWARASGQGIWNSGQTMTIISFNFFGIAFTSKVAKTCFQLKIKFFFRIFFTILIAYNCQYFTVNRSLECSLNLLWISIILYQFLKIISIVPYSIRGCIRFEVASFGKKLKQKSYLLFEFLG